MYHIHIACHEKDHPAALWLSWRLRWYYQHNKQHGSVSITLNSADFTGDPSAQNYLIVLCSMHTVNDDKVAADIRRFHANEQTSHIIPYVIGGQPHANDPKNECLPRIFTEILNSELLAVNSIELGGRTAFHRIISAIHNIPLNTLERRSKRQQIRRWLFIGLMTVLVCACSAYSEYTTSSHTEYYRSYTYAYGVPVGMERLTFAQRLKCKDYYIFEMHHTVPLSVRRAGNPPAMTAKDPSLQKYYDAIGTPAAIYSYHTDGTLDSAVHTDADGNILFVINYLAEGSVADFSELPDSIEPYFLSLDGEKTDYSRCLFEYDEEGCVSEIRYLINSRNS